MYALITNENIVYPYSYYNLQKDNPQISFPKEISEEILNQWRLKVVYETPCPQFDETTQVALRSGCAYNQDTTQWETSWIIYNLTQDEIDNRQIGKVD